MTTAISNQLTLRDVPAPLSRETDLEPIPTSWERGDALREWADMR